MQATALFAPGQMALATSRLAGGYTCDELDFRLLLSAFRNFRNYAPSVPPQIEAAKMGYQQILYLSPGDHHLTEVGTMNCFVYMKDDNGSK